MCTTLTIDANVLSEYKRVAADTHRTLSGVIEDSLREQLARHRALGATSGADLPVVRGGALVPGVDLTSKAAVQRLLDDGLPLEELRCRCCCPTSVSWSPRTAPRRAAPGGARVARCGSRRGPGDRRGDRRSGHRGTTVVTYDRDFARFAGLRWRTPG